LRKNIAVFAAARIGHIALAKTWIMRITRAHRSRCDEAWLGVRLDEAANRTGGPKISAGGSAVSVWVIPTDEDLMIACHTKDIIHVTGTHVTTRLDSDMSLC